MQSYWPLFWLGVGIVAAVTEGFTVQLISIWFAVSGAVTAVVLMFFPLDFPGQLLLFSVLGLVLLLLTRPFVKKKLQVRRECTNADRVVGEIGKVVVAIEPMTTGGRVSVLGMDWSAKSFGGEPIAQGALVRVRAIEGVTLIVEPAALSTPD